MLNNNKHKSLESNYTDSNTNRLLTFADIAPRGECTHPTYGINCLNIGLPVRYKNYSSDLRSLRLITYIDWSTEYDNFNKTPLNIIFRIESNLNRNGSPAYTDCFVDVYCNDLKDILVNDYGFKNITYHSGLNNGTYFTAHSPFKPTSFKEVEFLIYLCNTPIKLDGNNLSVTVVRDVNNFTYSVRVGSTRIFFHIGLSLDKTKCISYFYWDKSKLNKDFTYTDLQGQLDRALYGVLPFTQYLTGKCDYTIWNEQLGSDLPMSFKYRSDNKYCYLESSCVIEDSMYIRPYLVALLTNKLYWRSHNDIFEFLQLT